MAAARRGFDGPIEVAPEVFKTIHAQHLGKLSLAWLWRGSVKYEDHFGSQRLSGLYRHLGGKLDKSPTGTASEVVALGRLEETATGDVVGATPVDRVPWPAPLTPVFALAITATSREDEVKLSGALQKLVEEERDPGSQSQRREVRIDPGRAGRHAFAGGFGTSHRSFSCNRRHSGAADPQLWGRYQID